MPKSLFPRHLIPLAVTAALVLAHAPRLQGQCVGCEHPSFGPGVYFQPVPPWNARQSFDVGDATGDGIPDIVTANTTTDGVAAVSVFPGTGSGNFGPAVQIDVASGTLSVAIADFNLDGIPDLAAVTTSGVGILVGTGGGAFAPPVFYPDNYVYSETIVVADVNRDGKPDLIVSDLAYPTLLVYIGNGDATFQDPIGYDTGFDSQTSLAVGDVNGDGNPDLVVAHYYGEVTVLSGRPDGTFSPAVQIPGLDAWALVLGDFNGDGRLDIAAGRLVLSVLLGDGNGGFATSWTDPLGSWVRMSTADFDGDGIADLALSGYELGILHVFRGLGDGTFEKHVYDTVELYEVVAADLNSDGRPDLVSRGEGGMAAPLNDGTGGFQATIDTLAPVGSEPIFAADLNGDGRTDVVVGGFTNASIMLANGDGTFSAAAPVPSADRISAMGAGLFDADAHVDLVLSTGTSLSVLAGDGAGGFAPLVSYPDGAGVVAVGDVDGNGHADIVAVGYDGVLRAYLSQGDGTFVVKTSPIPITGLTGMLLGKFDAGATLDVVIDGYFLAGAGDGTFGPAVALPSAAYVLAAGDFNADGKLDLVTSYDATHVAIANGNGDGAFQAGVTYFVGEGPQSTLVADFNGDGVDDLALALIGNSSDSYAAVLTSAAGVLSAPAFYRIHAGFQHGAVGDFDGDGRPDIVTVAQSLDPRLAVLRNTNCTPRRLRVQTQPSSCDVPGAVWAVQPAVGVLDDGDNLLTCDGAVVTASLAAHTGTPGAVLGGTTTVNAVSGVATFTGLSVDRAGKGYRVAFSHPQARPVWSATFTEGLQVSIVGPSEVCDSGQATFRTGEGGSGDYVWSIDGAPFSWSPVASLPSLSPGSHTLSVVVAADTCTATDSRELTVGAAPPPPLISAPRFAAAGATGLAASVQAHDGSSYAWSIDGGALVGGQGTSEVTFDPGPAGTVVRLQAAEASPQGCLSSASEAFVPVDFLDVPIAHPLHDYIDTLLRSRVTGGCSAGNYCPSNVVTRAQMAVFLLKAEHGPTYLPPFCNRLFDDVACPSPFANWIEALAGEGITGGCGGDNYCPDSPVTRAQMAVFLLKTSHGSAYAPPPATGVFGDVAPGDFAAAWIEQLYADGVTGGCQANPLLYCPVSAVTRGQMAVFLVKTFNLP